MIKFPKQIPHTIVVHQAFHDDRLSMAAKGMFAMLLTLHTRKHFEKDDLADFCNDDEDSLKDPWAELLDYGYVRETVTEEGSIFTLEEVPLRAGAHQSGPALTCGGVRGHNARTQGGDTCAKSNYYIHNNPLIKKEKQKSLKNKNKKSLSQSESGQFTKFWDMYQKKIDKRKCLLKWNRLGTKDKQSILKGVPRYIELVPEYKFRKHPLTWLNGRCWEDEILWEDPKTNETKHTMSKPDKKPDQLGRAYREICLEAKTVFTGITNHENHRLDEIETLYQSFVERFGKRGKYQSVRRTISSDTRSIFRNYFHFIKDNYGGMASLKVSMCIPESKIWNKYLDHLKRKLRKEFNVRIEK